MGSCNECQERVTNCGPISYAMCVRYEGSIRIGSPLEGLCELSVQDVIEDLYSLIEESGNIYYNGDGILLNNNTFSLDYSKVRSANWKPTWEDIQGDKPEQVNLIEGSNIHITGTYPNLTISSDSTSGISSVSIEGTPQPEVSGNVDLKRANSQRYGVVRLGGNIVMDASGNIMAPTYSDGQGIQKTDNVFSLAYETTGTGNVVGNVERTANGIKVTYTNATGSDYILPDASSTVKGGVKLATDNVQTVNASSTSSTVNRTYAVQKDSNGGLVVNVPWNNTGYSLATVDVPGIIRLGSDTQYIGLIENPTSVQGRTYPVQLTNTGRAIVNIPWVTYDTATSTTTGFVKIASNAMQTTEANPVTNVASRTYGVQYNSAGQLVVNVPWIEGSSGTTYYNGTGLNLSGTTFSVSYGTTAGTSAQGNDSRINNGQTAYTWGNHASVGYLTSVPLATASVVGGRKLFSDTVQTVAPNLVTSTASRTYGVQVNSSGQMVVNVPWTSDGGSYVQGSGISISGNTISNSSPNATHTGEVTGSTALTISNNVVSNAKLTQMPALTVKANISNSNAIPQDVSIETLRDYLNIGTQTIILDSLNANVNPQSFNQTAVFCKLTDTDLTTISIEDGVYDGQQLYFQFNYYNSEASSSVDLTGNLINFVPGQESAHQVILKAVNSKELFLFWSTDTNCWMTRIIPKLP